MFVPSTPLASTVIYIVRINSEEPNEYKTPANASKYVAENIFVGHWAVVEFKNAADVKQVRENFNARMETAPAGGAYRRVLVSAHRDWCVLSAKERHILVLLFPPRRGDVPPLQSREHRGHRLLAGACLRFGVPGI
jgi:hypothetical protein